MPDQYQLGYDHTKKKYMQELLILLHRMLSAHVLVG